MTADPWLPLLFTVGWFKSTEVHNSMDDPVPGYAPRRDLQVFGWDVSGGAESTQYASVQVAYDAVVYVPTETGIRATDRIELPGYGLFEVDGPPGNWDHNPWWTPGLVEVRLKSLGQEVV